MGKYESLAKNIIANVGGKENVNSLTHCMTRLRFQLKDESIANDDILKNMNGIVTVMHSAGQYQVVIGNHVSFVYEDICALLGIETKANSDEEEEAPKGVFNKLIDIISGCFSPVLASMCACGIIKGINALCLFLIGSQYSTSGTYMIMNAIGDSVFYFMPVLLGYTAAKKFKVNPFVGMLIGAAMCYPTIQKSALSANEVLGTIPMIGDYYSKFLGIPFVAGNYTSSVIPVLFIVYFASHIQKLAKKIIPEFLQSFFVPLFVLLISMPVGYLLIGPVIGVITNILLNGFKVLYSISPVVTGLISGGLWQCLVIFGLQWAILPISIANMAEIGYDTIMVGTFGATFAQTAVIIAMYLKTKNADKKALAIPTIISGMCGVTEPAIYGFTLPEKKPFIYSCIAAALGGATFVALGGKKFVQGGLGIFGVVNFISPDGDASGMWASFICIAVSMVVAFALTMILWSDKEPEKTEKVEIEPKDTILQKPMNGKIIPLSEVKDDAFNSEALGKGMAVIPEEGVLYAPMDGNVEMLFPSLHAIGLIDENGCQVLIHIGLNTVELNGQHFKAFVKEGDTVKAGQKLIEFDLEKIRALGYDMTTPMIVTNTDQYKDVAVDLDNDKAVITAIV